MNASSTIHIDLGIIAALLVLIWITLLVRLRK